LHIASLWGNYKTVEFAGEAGILLHMFAKFMILK
jgi:hypothetical protein